jgi:hypothetical protein
MKIENKSPSNAAVQIIENDSKKNQNNFQERIKDMGKC